MSYDVSVEGTDIDLNYTSNCSKLWYDHFPNGDGLRGLDKMTAKQALQEIRGFFDKVDSTVIDMWSGKDIGEPKFTEKYDAKNGWGSTIGSLIFISKIQCALEMADETAIVEVDC